MTNKYDRLSSIWNPEQNLLRWVSVELAMLLAHEKHGTVPPGTATRIINSPIPTLQQVQHHEEATGHEVVGFLNAWRHTLGHNEDSNYLHLGMTSSDLTDTALALAINESSTQILSMVDFCVQQWSAVTLDHVDTVCLGRTHGQAATPMTLGHRLTTLIVALKSAAHSVPLIPAKMSGPVGDHVFISRTEEEQVSGLLGLEACPSSSQIVPRVWLAMWAASMANIASCVEAMALQLRLMSQEGINEASEGFKKGQVGSSCMPHKRNPINSERACGLARVVRSNISPIMEGIAVWYERDISHSSVERVLVPQTANLTAYLVDWLGKAASTVSFDVDQMASNLQGAGNKVNSFYELNQSVLDGQPQPQSYVGLYQGQQSRLAPHPITPPQEVAWIQALANPTG